MSDDPGKWTEEFIKASGVTQSEGNGNRVCIPSGHRFGKPTLWKDGVATPTVFPGDYQLLPRDSVFQYTCLDCGKTSIWCHDPPGWKTHYDITEDGWVVEWRRV